jgi:6-phosphogluconolactonase
MIAGDGSLTPHGKIIPSGGKSSCHLSVSPGRNFLYCANYFSGSFTEYRLAPDGAIAERTRIIRHQGSGPNKLRQETAHPHCCVFSPDGKFLTIADLGCDRVYAYPFSEENGIDQDSPVITTLEAGCGPRHILFGPAAPIVYLVTELSNCLLSFSWQDGKLIPIEELYLLPRGAQMPFKASALRFSADRKFIVCTNRGFDSLASVELDGKGGIFPAALTLSGGSSPRDVNFIGENFFAAANEFSDEVRFFDFEPATGVLTPNGYQVQMPRPLCIMQYK